MSRSPAILRRYTPPTCTLEVMANSSPLSRWAAQPVVKDVRFQLNLDDPKLPDDQWITLKGDRTQLEALRDAVSDYVHHLLIDSAQGFDFSAQLQPDQAAIAPLSLVTSQADPTASPLNAAGISLQPQGGLNHRLHLGSLTPVDASSEVQLTTLQLFDLANALDEYSADLLELPTLPRSRWSKPFPEWASAVAVMLVAVGLTTSAVKLMDGSMNDAPTLPTSSQGASSSDQKIATQLPPAVVEKATPPVLSVQKLPPPPPPASVTPPKPGMPTVSLPKLSPSPPPASGLPPGAIATYPVPVPERPTVTGEGVQLESRSQAPAQIAIAPNPAAAARISDRMQQAPQRSLAKASGEAANAAGSTAFDTIPQVAEARSYFQQRWKPPEGLTQTLEYTLQVNADGTIQSITPLKQASGDYLDRSSIPLLGEPFVSPLKTRQNAKIRLVLEPNGEVRTFLEGN